MVKVKVKVKVFRFINSHKIVCWFGLVCSSSVNHQALPLQINS
ncbi:hypothetical protein SOVF_114750 [Spinacia oleracea]|nr:hypothetical protein SOVF_114750 [Spinacia oleracea]